jgi:PIN domain nuclease of toxin-antitoxin system
LNLLLDTHALLWWVTDDPKISQTARDALGAPQTTVFFSAASAWEIETKINLGKLTAPSDWLEQVEASQLTALDISVHHAKEAGTLPLHHRDPFDRMLIAQAIVEGLTIVTRDRNIRRYDVPVLLA